MSQPGERLPPVEVQEQDWICCRWRLVLGDGAEVRLRPSKSRLIWGWGSKLQAEVAVAQARLDGWAWEAWRPERGKSTDPEVIAMAIEAVERLGRGQGGQ